MPLAFESLSHGTVAFGFFHVETDMLLLQELFFFTDDFSDVVSHMATCPKEVLFEKALPGYQFAKPEHVGDLMGAIHGIRLSGFIGSLYRRCPFPQRPEEFKQKPKGCFSRKTVTAEIRKWAKPCRIPFRKYSPGNTVSIGGYHFAPRVFKALVTYVWRGGYPQWAGGRRPAYVLAMMDALNKGGWDGDLRGD